jgi:hypothetical protein
MMKTTLLVLLLALMLSACGQTNNNGASSRLSGVSTNPYKGSLRNLIPKKVRGCELMHIRDHPTNGQEEVENIVVSCFTNQEDLERYRSSGLSGGSETIIRVVNWSTIEQAKKALDGYRSGFEYLRKEVSDPEHVVITSSPNMRDGRQVGEKIVVEHTTTSQREMAWSDGTVVFGTTRASKYKIQAIEESLISEK